MVGFRDFVGTDFAPVSNKTAVKIKTLELLIAMAMVYDVMKIMLHFSGHKPSYSSSPVVWIRQASLQSDIQKVLRHARKMPEKTPHFYKELNGIRKAISYILN